MNLTDDQIDIIAERAAQRALQIVYAEVGKGIMKKLAWLIGVVVVGAAAWLGGKGYLSQ